MDPYISLDIKDAFLVVPQVEVMLLGSLNGWVNVLQSQETHWQQCCSVWSALVQQSLPTWIGALMGRSDSAHGSL